MLRNLKLDLKGGGKSSKSFKPGESCNWKYRSGNALEPEGRTTA